MTAQLLFEKHVANQLARFRHTDLLRALEEGLLPDRDHELVQSALPVLQEELASQGVTEQDELLIRYGLIVPGMIEGIHPPISNLSPENGGFCTDRIEAAASAIKDARQFLDFARNVIPNLNPETSAAFLEIARSAEQSSAIDDAWVNAHTHLPKPEYDVLVQRALRHLDGNTRLEHDLATEILAALAQFRLEGLGDLAELLLEKETFWPSLLYRDASEKVAAKLVHRALHATDVPSYVQSLRALAWTRSKTAHQTFSAWHRSPPDAHSLVSGSVTDFSLDAGWVLESEEAPKQLYPPVCHRIRTLPGGSPSTEIACRNSISEVCPICNQHLSWLFDFANLPASLFSGPLEAAPRRILACLSCALFVPIFSRYSSDSTAVWHPGTTPHPHGACFVPNPLRLHFAFEPFPPYAAASPFSLDNSSTFGGMPSFLQHPEYPFCPDCGRYMFFLAQLDNASSPEIEEGVYYAFFCPDCQVSAVTCQHT